MQRRADDFLEQGRLASEGPATSGRAWHSQNDRRFTMGRDRKSVDNRTGAKEAPIDFIAESEFVFCQNGGNMTPLDPSVEPQHNS
jgi:hypothetical protein